MVLVSDEASRKVELVLILGCLSKSAGNHHETGVYGLIVETVQEDFVEGMGA